MKNLPAKQVEKITFRIPSADDDTAMVRNGERISMPEKTDLLNGMEVEVIGEGLIGTVYFTYLNREKKAGMIGVNFDEYARIFSYTQLRAVNPSIEQRKLLE